MKQNFGEASRSILFVALRLRLCLDYTGWPVGYANMETFLLKNDWTVTAQKLNRSCLVPVRRFPSPSRQFTSVTYPRPLDHLTRTALAAWNNEAWELGKNRSFTYRSHTLNIVQEQLTERVWCTNSHLSLLNIYFRLRGFQSPLLLLRSKHPETLWQRVAETYPICDNPLSRSSRCSFVPLQTSNRNHRVNTA